MPTQRISPRPRVQVERAPAQWPCALPAMVDEETNEYIRALQRRRGDRSLAITLRHLLALGIKADRRQSGGTRKAA